MLAMRHLLVLLAVLVCAANGVPKTWPDWYNLVQKIGANPDPVARNFQISAGYYNLGLAFGRLLGTDVSGGSQYAINWPTMAAWASNSVGVSIRKEVPTGWMRSVLSFLPRPVVDLLLKFPALVAQLFDGLLTQTSKALAAGNVAVWIDVGSIHSLFGVHYGNLTAPDAAANARYNATFRCTDAVCAEMKEAMQWYYLAMFEKDPAVKQQLLFIGNAFVGQAEQTKLQPFVSGALLHNYTFHALGMTFVIPAEQLTTYFMISLMLPNEFLLCSRDVPDMLGTNTPFPPPVATFTLPYARSLYYHFTNQTDSLHGTAATDWYSLGQRLRFIVPLFRRCQQDTQMVRCPPFTPAQFAMIEQGQKPRTADLCLEANCCPGTKRLESA